MAGNPASGRRIHITGRRWLLFCPHTEPRLQLLQFSRINLSTLCPLSFFVDGKDTIYKQESASDNVHLGLRSAVRPFLQVAIYRELQDIDAI
jgi:hypothetical protein